MSSCAHSLSTQLYAQTHYTSVCAYVTLHARVKRDDEQIKNDLYDSDYYSIIPENPNPKAIEKVKAWVKKWDKKGIVPEEITAFANNVDDSHPGKCKPLVKTHKQPPYPIRLLLSGCGTPVEPLSKIVQMSIRHLTEHLPHQVIDTKEFLQKVKKINDNHQLPETATIAVCDVVALYPNVNNKMGIPATKKLLKEHPSPVDLPEKCIMEGLDIALDNNYTQHMDLQGNMIYAKPIRGTAMGPSHSCDYVDIFMGELDQKIVKDSPVPLLSSLDPNNLPQELDWSRFRDDGITILPNEKDVDKFTEHLQSLHPPHIKWTMKHGKQAEYLDVQLEIKDGKITTDVFSKHNQAICPQQVATRHQYSKVLYHQ